MRAATDHLMWPPLPLTGTVYARDADPYHYANDHSPQSFAVANTYVGSFVEAKKEQDNQQCHIERNPKWHYPNSISHAGHLAAASHHNPFAIYSVHRSAYTTASGEDQDDPVGAEAKREALAFINAWVGREAKVNHHRSFFYHFAIKNRLNIITIPLLERLGMERFPYASAFLGQMMQNPLQNLAQVLVLDYAVKKDIPLSGYSALLDPTTAKGFAEYMPPVDITNMHSIFHHFLYYTTTYAHTIPSYVICVVNYGGPELGYNPAIGNSVVDCRGVVKDVCVPPIEWYNSHYWYPPHGQDSSIPTNANCPFEHRVPALKTAAEIQTKKMHDDLKTLFSKQNTTGWAYSSSRGDRPHESGLRRHRIIRCIAQDLPGLLEEIKHNAIAARLQLLHFAMSIAMRYTPKDQVGIA